MVSDKPPPVESKSASAEQVLRSSKRRPVRSRTESEKAERPKDSTAPYVVTTGAFSQYNNAEKLCLLLIEGGYPARIIAPVATSEKGDLYVVVVSGFETALDADTALLSHDFLGVYPTGKDVMKKLGLPGP